MLIRFGHEIVLESAVPVPMLLALSPHPDFDGRLIGSNRVHTEPDLPVEEYLDSFGNRISRIVMPAGGLTLWTDCFAEVDGEPDVVAMNAPQRAIENLPHETLVFLASSRYCESDEFSDMAWKMFGHTAPAWQRVQAICDFVHERTTFGYKFGRATKTAQDVHEEMTGVCRDFAHLAITLCRAMNIPARYASGYLGDIGVAKSGPGDFCAWFEAFLGDRWYTFDARHNTPRIGRILMVRGRDAADVAMMTSFGAYDLKGFTVWTDEVTGPKSDEDLLEALQARPDVESLIVPSSARIVS